MPFKMRYKNLEEVIDQLYNASKKHAGQAKVIEKHLKSIKSPPTKDGSLQDFQSGTKGHNPDTMSASHEDFHLKQSGESPAKATRKVCLPKAKIARMSKAERQKVINAKRAAAAQGKTRRSSKSFIRDGSTRSKGLRDWVKQDWRQVANPSKKCGEK